MNNRIGKDAGCVLEGTISLSTEYHFRFILGVQSWMKLIETNEQMEM